MRDVKHWGVLTIGTGLGNARFTNREDERIGACEYVVARIALAAPYAGCTIGRTVS